MAKPKAKEQPTHRTPKPKKALGLAVRPALRMPHEDLIKRESPDVDAHTSASVDALQAGVDAKTPTGVVSVDALTPTSEESGRPLMQSVNAHKRDRHSKARARLSLRPEAAILKRFKVFCAEKNLDMQEFFELAGAHYIEHVNAHMKQNVDALAPNDDLMMFYKTDEDIIKLYQHYNPGNKWKASDDRVACNYNRVDRRVLEYAFILTQVNARFKKINSFRYYEDEIRDCLEKHLSSETLDAMVASARRTWAKAKAK